MCVFLKKHSALFYGFGSELFLGKSFLGRSLYETSYIDHILLQSLELGAELAPVLENQQPEQGTSRRQRLLYLHLECDQRKHWWA